MPTPLNRADKPRFRQGPPLRSGDRAAIETRFTVAPYDYAAAERLAAALGVSHVLAQVLVRRGLGDVEEAARSSPPPKHIRSAFAGLRAAAVILDHARRRSGSRSTATTTSTASPPPRCSCRALRTLGAEVHWYLPSRIDDGYGLAAATVARLAERGTDLLVTVDCAITAVEEVAARARPGSTSW